MVVAIWKRFRAGWNRFQYNAVYTAKSSPKASARGRRSPDGLPRKGDGKGERDRRSVGQRCPGRSEGPTTSRRQRVSANPRDPPTDSAAVDRPLRKAGRGTHVSGFCRKRHRRSSKVPGRTKPLTVFWGHATDMTARRLPRECQLERPGTQDRDLRNDPRPVTSCARARQHDAAGNAICENGSGAGSRWRRWKHLSQPALPFPCHVEHVTFISLHEYRGGIEYS
jgi:hypothetical protein